jgi:hypothetical protein
VIAPRRAPLLFLGFAAGQTCATGREICKTEGRTGRSTTARIFGRHAMGIGRYRVLEAP